jgi:hypothetical protein
MHPQRADGLEGFQFDPFRAALGKARLSSDHPTFQRLFVPYRAVDPSNNRRQANVHRTAAFVEHASERPGNGPTGEAKSACAASALADQRAVRGIGISETAWGQPRRAMRQ